MYGKACQSKLDKMKVAVRKSKGMKMKNLTLELNMKIFESMVMKIKIRNVTRLQKWLAALTTIVLLISQNGIAVPLVASDLAIVMPRDHVGLGVASGLFEPRWYDQVKDAYLNTSVGDAFDRENSYTDWQIVAIRVVPCSPLGESPKQNIDVYCWPEVRIVWQPILLSSVPGREKNFADDRAIHALYDVDAAIYLNPDAAKILNRTKDQLRKSLSELKDPGLSDQELRSFVDSRNALAKSFLKDFYDLRLTDPQGKIEVRTEFQSQMTAKKFVTKLLTLLKKITPTKSINHLTSFSLPEGKDAPSLDEWVFLKFSGSNGNLTSVSIELTSAESGRKIFDFGFAPIASMMRDDPSLYDWLERNPNKEIEKNVMVFGDRTSHSHISDRRIIGVSNTSCGSCHKLKTERFNFHALSYLGRDELEVSPRVIKDVELDLAWLRSYLNPTP